MKTNELGRRTIIIATSIVLSTLAYAADLPQKSEKTNSTGVTSNRGLSVLAEHPNAQHCSDMLGKPVRNSSGTEIGKLKDFVIDRDSGAIRFALVSTGGLLGVADEVRAVPTSAIKRSENRDGFTVNIDQAKWKNAPLIGDNQLSALQQNNRGKQIYQYYGQRWPDSSKSDNMERFAYARELKGKHVRSEGKDVGKIEDLIVNLDRARASVILDPDDEFTGTDAKYVISFDKLNDGTARGEDFTTKLTRSDFQSAQPFADLYWDTPTFVTIYTWAIEPVATNTTDVNSSANKNASQAMATSNAKDQKRNAPVAAIRNAIQQDPSLPAAAKTVDVLAQNGKVVLRGTVSSEDVKQKIEHKAESVANGWSVDDEVKVAKSD